MMSDALVILGAAHHYVFDAPPELVALTQSPLPDNLVLFQHPVELMARAYGL